jgi:hypothetical protein
MATQKKRKWGMTGFDEMFCVCVQSGWCRKLPYNNFGKQIRANKITARAKAIVSPYFTANDLAFAFA